MAGQTSGRSVLFHTQHKLSQNREQRYWSAWPEDSVCMWWFTWLCVSSAHLEPSTSADGKCFLLCTAELHEEQACGRRAQYCCSSLSQQNGLPGHQHAKARFRTRSPQPNAAPQGAPATARLNATGGANHQRKTPSTRLARSSPAFEPKSSWAPRQKHSRRAALRAIRARLPPVLASTLWTQGTGPDGKFPDQKRPTV